LTRFRTLTVFAALLALATALAACGGGGSDDPQTVLDEATLQGIESAEMDLALGIDAKGSEGGHVEISLSGPFRSESEAELPEFDLSASAKGKIGGEKVDFDGGLTLLGDKAYVAYEKSEYEVDPTTFNFVRSLIRQRTGVENPSSEVTACEEAAKDAVQLSRFVEKPRDGGSADVGKTSTTKISGDLAVAVAVDATIELTEDPACSEQLHAAGSLPSKAKLEKSKREIEQGVKSAHVDVYVGDDHIVRRVVAQITIAPKAKSAKASSIKSIQSEFDLKLTGVNEEQAIEAPKSSKPLSALFVKLGINPIELLGLLQGGKGGLNGPGGIDELLEGIRPGGIQ
jgi:hypothetical protein